MTGAKNPIDEFRRVTGAAIRAIGEKNDIQVSFAPASAGGHAGLMGTDARLTAPSRHMPAAEVACTRGEADAIALKLKHHNVRTHTRECPKTPLAREIFNAIETARVEAIDAGIQRGVAPELDDSRKRRRRRPVRPAVEAIELDELLSTPAPPAGRGKPVA